MKEHENPYWQKVSPEKQEKFHASRTSKTYIGHDGKEHPHVTHGWTSEEYNKWENNNK